MSNSHLNKLKSAIKDGTEVTLNLSLNLVGNSNNWTTFPYKLLLTNIQVSKICKTFATGLSANIKFSKTHLSKIVQLKGVLFGQPNTFGSPIKEIRSSSNSIRNSFGKKLKN